MRIAVTGAFGYSGRYIAQRLLEAGHDVFTLTNSLNRANPFGGRVRAFPFHFDRPDLLKQNLEGTEVLVNTYWVRFNHPRFTFREAIANTKVLFLAAKDVGVRRIIHISITNPDIQSDLPYFSGKTEVEAALQSLGLSYCIFRPAVLFGREDILINNIAWTLRHMPMFGLFGSGNYRLQPIYVDDLARAVVCAAADEGNNVVNAIGPETFTYRELVQFIRRTLGLRRLVVGLPSALGYWGCRITGLLVRDVVVTRDEIRGLMEEKLYVNDAPLGATKLTEWIELHKDTLGRRYANELSRRIDRLAAYSAN